MALLDFILNLIGLLLWCNWRARRFDLVAHTRPATLTGTIRRAGNHPLRRWHLPLLLVGLLLLRAPLYETFGAALGWTGKIDVGPISVPFRTDTGTNLMLLYSVFSFGIVWGVFLIWTLFFSTLKITATEPDSFRFLLHLQLGKIVNWPFLPKALLPLLAVSALWWLASWPLNHFHLLPPPASAGVRIEQALLVGLGSYLTLKYPLVIVLALYAIHTYVFFGRHIFWRYLDQIGRQLLQPLRRWPLQFRRIDFAPVVAIAAALLVAHVVENGIKTPLRYNAAGKPAGRLVNLPGLVDLYARTTR